MKTSGPTISEPERRKRGQRKLTIRLTANEYHALANYREDPDEEPGAIARRIVRQAVQKRKRKHA